MRRKSEITRESETTKKLKGWRALLGFVIIVTAGLLLVHYVEGW